MNNSNKLNLNATGFRTVHRQRGWTFWSFLFVISVVLFFSYIGMQLVPIYSANNNVRNAMARSLDNTDLNQISRAYIIRKMDAQLYLDGSHKLLDYKTDLKIKKSRKQIFVETNYRREIPLFFNITLVVSFDNVEQRNLSGVP